MYDYVKRTYSVSPEVGRRVTHQITKKSGEIRRENHSMGHYVMVRFDGQKHLSPCHPTELDYQRPNNTAEPAKTPDEAIEAMAMCPYWNGSMSLGDAQS